MFHVCAFEEAVGTTANTDLDAIPDDVFNIVSDHFQLQQDHSLIFAAACGATINRARLVAPSLRQITLPFIIPPTEAATFTDVLQIADYRDNPFVIRSLEEFAAEITSDIAMGTEQSFVVCGLRRQFQPAPRGNVYTLRGTSTTTTTALRWTNLTVTWADTPPAGTYAVVGMRIFGATQIAGRLIFENQVPRPGCLAVTDLAHDQPAMFLKGGLGEWGRFTSTRMPIVQALNVAAVATHEVFLDFVRVS